MTSDEPMDEVEAPGVARPRDRRRFRFADFELAADSGELLRRDQHGIQRPVRLQPQPAKVLLYLAQRAGTLVTREELQRHLWGADHFVDYDQGLNYCIRAVRRALGDHASEPQFLETVPRRGYRFRRPVEVADAPGRDNVRSLLQVVSPPAASRRQRVRRATFLAGGIAALSLVFHWVLWAGLLETSEPPKLAVMLLDDHSGTQVGSALAGSLTDELISNLSSSYPDELGVIARTSSIAYAGQRLTAAQIGSELNADYLLTGGMQTSSGMTRITVELIRVRDQTNLWAEIYHRPLDQTDWDAWVQTVSLRVAERLALATTRLDSPNDTSRSRPASSSKTARGNDSGDVSG